MEETLKEWCIEPWNHKKKTLKVQRKRNCNKMMQIANSLSINQPAPILRKCKFLANFIALSSKFNWNHKRINPQQFDPWDCDYMESKKNLYVHWSRRIHCTCTWAQRQGTTPTGRSIDSIVSTPGRISGFCRSNKESLS